MRLSQVLVIAAASFLFAGEAIAVTMDSNQAKISTVARGSPSQRLLRKYEETDSDDLDDLDYLNSEERGIESIVQALATQWGHSVDDISNGLVRLTEKQHEAWKAIVNKGIEASKKAKRDAANAAWRRDHGIGRRV
ncbi:Secreted RxLR effector peptide protein [Phytophthora palmivora]|uniref:RxLR effector protein n=1 Tax=Phytophthora palmivora TaxID=4796 RepID=A0A2P4XXH9_9STRA|nr:Secreted RxLR effector peptide protein [Phytophthora palmivora]